MACQLVHSFALGWGSCSSRSFGNVTREQVFLLSVGWPGLRQCGRCPRQSPLEVGGLRSLLLSRRETRSAGLSVFQLCAQRLSHLLKPICSSTICFSSTDWLQRCDSSRGPLTKQDVFRALSLWLSLRCLSCLSNTSQCKRRGLPKTKRMGYSDMHESSLCPCAETESAQAFAISTCQHG